MPLDYTGKYILRRPADIWLRVPARILLDGPGAGSVFSYVCIAQQVKQIHIERKLLSRRTATYWGIPLGQPRASDTQLLARGKYRIIQLRNPSHWHPLLAVIAISGDTADYDVTLPGMMSLPELVTYDAVSDEAP